MIDIKIRHELYSCDFKFERRLNIIKGDSGTGKSTFATIVRDKRNADKFESTLDIIQVFEDTWKPVVRGERDKILIFDDLNVVSTLDFARYYSKYAISNNLYFLIISRESLRFDSMKNLSFSSNSIFKLVKNGIYHELEKYYSYGESSTSDFEVCVVEDTKKGYTFFKELFKGVLDVVPSTGGKSTIVADVLKLSKEYTNILVIVDTSAYGCHMEEFCTLFEGIESNICFLSDYECFEELLLRTNLLNRLRDVIDGFNNLTVDANNFVSWKKYFEDLVYRVTMNKPYRYSHGMKNLCSCYLRSCDVCPDYRKNKCDWNSVGDKFIALLKDTKYGYLLDFHK